MKVKEVEHLLRFFPAKVKQSMSLLLPFDTKLSTSADADASSVPSQAGLVGRLAEPKIAMVKEPQLVFLIKDGFMFTAPFSVITANADVIIAIKGP